MNKTKKITAIILALIISLSMTACGKQENQASTPIAPAPVKENSVEAFGVVKASDMYNVNISFEAAVLKVAAKEGQRVRKDDVLVTLNLNDYMLQIEAKQHELNSVNLEISKLQSKMTDTDAAKSNDSDVKKLLNDLKYAKQVYQSIIEEHADKQELYSSGAISKYELDEFTKVVEERKKNIDDLTYSLDIAVRNKQLSNTELLDNIKIQQERAVSIKQEIAAMKEKLNKPYIKGQDIISYVDNGVVFDLGYVDGDIVNPAQKLLSIMNLDGMIVKANIAEEFIKDVKPGQRVDIIPVADKSKKYTGTVSMIASRAVIQNGETVIPVEITIDDNDGFLMPEYNVDVEIFY